MVSAADPNARWQLVPDREGDDPPNSQRTPGVDQEFYDQFNLLRRNVRTLGCQQDPNTYPGLPLMQVTNDVIKDLSGLRDPAGLEEVRSVVSVSAILGKYFDKKILALWYRRLTIHDMLAEPRCAKAYST